MSRSLFTISNENSVEPTTPIKPIEDFEKSIKLRSNENDFPSLCSTPIRHNGTNSKHSSFGSTTANHGRSTVPVNNTTFSPQVQVFSGGKVQQSSSRNSSTSSSLCLSDFITPTSSKSKNRKTPKSQSQQHSDNSNSMISEQEFPSLGARTKIGSLLQSSSNNNISSSPSVTPKPITILRPKKRVAPITVATHTSRNVFGSPAFRSDNNLLNISSIDIHNDDDNNLIDSRILLKTNIEEISKDFKK